MKLARIARCALVLVCSIGIAIAGTCAPHIAIAQDSTHNLQQLSSEVDTLVAKIEQTTATYKEAEAAVRALEEQITLNEAHVAELTSQIPAQRTRAAASIKEMYLFQQDSLNLLAIILCSETFDDFLTALRYLDVIQERNINQISRLMHLTDELTRSNADLQLEREAAVQKRSEALAALEEARGVRAELQAKAISVALLEQEDREAAIAVAQKALAASSDATFVTSSGNTAKVQVPNGSSVSTDALVSNITADETEDWATRINAYLEGSPLEGYGETFAAAAAEYGVDPRLSPAIATIESGKGSVCFQDHNAWGWGNESYPDWETAIYDQVAGLANGYDGTLTMEGAEKYCPPNAEEWYSSVASEMDGI